MVKINQKNFNEFTQALNHRMTRIESDVKWMKRIGYYMASVMTVGVGILIKGVVA